MTIASALTISLSGIQAASTQLEQAASNISNASTDGYTTKSVTTTSASLGNVGGGSRVVGFTRAENAALYKTLTKATTNNGLREQQDGYQQQVQDLLGTSSTDNPTLTRSLSDFVNSWKTYAASPESLVSSRQVIQDAVTFTDEIKRIANGIEDLDRQIQDDVDSTLTALNSKLEQIADLNTKISQAVNSGLSTADLQDKRDLLSLEVAEMTDITVLERPFGQIALYTGTGYQMVDGQTFRSFSYDGTDISSASNPGLSLNTAMRGGSIEALVGFRATSTPISTDGSVNVIQKLRDQLDEITNAFLTTVTSATSGEVTFAQAYNSATTAAGELASDFFTGTNRTTISVNAALLDGTSNLKGDAAAGVTDALIDNTRTYSADGLTVTNVNYTTLVTSSLVGFQQAANNATTLANTAEGSMSYLKEKYINETGVNVDNELIKLTEYQNAYNASAHVMSVVKEMFRTLETLL